LNITPTKGKAALPELDGGAAHFDGLQPAGLTRYTLLGLHLHTLRSLLTVFLISDDFFYTGSGFDFSCHKNDPDMNLVPNLSHSPTSEKVQANELFK